jgi:hypothetical protein
VSCLRAVRSSSKKATLFVKCAAISSTIGQLDSMREERTRLQLRNLSLPPSEWQAFELKPYGFVVDYEQEIEMGDPIRSDTTAYLEGDLRCCPELRLRRILQNIVYSSLDNDLTARFQFTLYTDLSSDRWYGERFPKIWIGEDGWWFVDIPAPLLWKPEVTDLFLEFLILHEMGHALAGSSHRSSQASEFEADHWASFEGLPAIHGDAGAASIRTYIAHQYEEYLKSCYSSTTFMRSTCTQSPLSEYPRLSARQAAITDPFFECERYDGGLTYPSSAWDVAQNCGKGSTIDDRRWVRGQCDTSIPKDCVLLPNGQKLCGISIYNAELLPFLMELNSRCNKYPDRCVDPKASLTISPSASVRRLADRSDRHMKKAITDLRKALKEMDE